MKRFIPQEDRNQTTLFPESLDDYVAEDNPVRIVDAFVDGLNLADLGFEGTTPAKTGMKDLESNIARYLAEMDTADRQEPEIAQLRTTRLKEKIAALKEQMTAMQAVKEELAKAPDGQLSQTDPDARSMKTRGTSVVGYNVQISLVS